MPASGDSFKLSQLRIGCSGDIIQKSWQRSHRAQNTSSPVENPQCCGTKGCTPAFASNYDLELSLCMCEPLDSLLGFSLVPAAKHCTLFLYNQDISSLCLCKTRQDTSNTQSSIQDSKPWITPLNNPNHTDDWSQCKPCSQSVHPQELMPKSITLCRYPTVEMNACRLFCFVQLFLGAR